MHFEFQNKLNGNICLRASTINLNEAHAPHKKNHIHTYEQIANLISNH